MSEPQHRPTAAPISMASVVSLLLGIAALVLLPLAPILFPVALLLAIAALVVGVVAALNAGRRGESTSWLAYVGGGIGNYRHGGGRDSLGDLRRRLSVRRHT